MLQPLIEIRCTSNRVFHRFAINAYDIDVPYESSKKFPIPL